MQGLENFNFFNWARLGGGNDWAYRWHFILFMLFITNDLVRFQKLRVYAQVRYLAIYKSSNQNYNQNYTILYLYRTKPLSARCCANKVSKEKVTYKFCYSAVNNQIESVHSVWKSYFQSSRPCSIDALPSHINHNAMLLSLFVLQLIMSYTK